MVLGALKAIISPDDKKCFVSIKRGVGSPKIGFDLVIVLEFWENRLFF